MDYINLAKLALSTSNIDHDLAYLRGNKGSLVRDFGILAYEDMIRAVKKGCPADDAIDHYERKKSAKDAPVKVEKAPPIMGSSEWANWIQLMQAGVLHSADERPTTSETYFGAFLNPDPELRQRKENWLYWDGDSHLMTIAPTGSGKSAVQIIPNLLTYSGSVFVFDPKGELYQATSFYRSQIGKVYRLAPFEDDSDAFNPLHGVKTFDDALELSQSVFPAEAVGDGAFYENEARGFLAALIYLMSFQTNNTMSGVRAITAQPADKFRATVEKIANTENLPTAIRRAADLVRGFEKKIISTLQRSLFEKLQIWDSEAVQKVSAHSDFNFSEMKQETVTVYVTVPFNRIDAYSHYVKAIMTTALEAMVSTPERPQQPVLFVLDEFLALGSFKKFVSALRTHRDAGVRLWYFLQSVSDLEALYPQEWRAFFTATEVKSFFGVRDHYTGELVSNLLGNQTLAYTTTSINTGMSSSVSSGMFDSGNKSSSHNQGINSNINLTSRPLLNPQEVQKILGNSDPDGIRHGILNFPGLNPIQVIHVPWYKGYNFWCRFGSRNNQVGYSPTLNHLWHCFNSDFFDGQLSQPLAIEYQDFSMGRDGHAPFQPGMRAFHDSQHNRIIFMEACRQVEQTYLNTVYSEQPADQDKADVAFAFLARILLHEMIHQAAFELGNAPHDNHGEVFTEYANKVYEKSKVFNTGFQFLPPRKAIMDQWPMVQELDAVLQAIQA